MTLKPEPLLNNYWVLLGGSWVVISGIISKVTILITLIRGLITLLVTTHEPPSIGRFRRLPDPSQQRSESQPSASASWLSVSALRVNLGFGVLYFNSFLGTCYLKGTITK